VTDDGPGRSATTTASVWFVGDIDDPWVAAVADALTPPSPAPFTVRRFSCPGDLSDGLLDAPRPPDVLVLHRAVLTRHDAERLARFRAARTPPPRVVLCFGPYVRHGDLERWAPLFEAAVPEATAVETIARHLGPGAEAAGRPAGTSARPDAAVAVVSTNAALRQTLAEAVEALGYTAAPARDWLDAPPAGPAVWDVPVLEPDWPQVLARRCRLGPVVALLGFADRALVAEARARGASACLELPYDLADLAAALGRLPATAPAPIAPAVSLRNEPPHPTPPAPAARRLAAVGGSPPARRVAEQGRDS
jgi:hypothetical protein